MTAKNRLETLKSTKRDIIQFDDKIHTWLDVDTGLVWEVKTRENVSFRYTFDKNQKPAGSYHNAKLEDDVKDIFSYANKLNRINYGGYNDWRIPTKEELMSIRDSGRYPDQKYTIKLIKIPLNNNCGRHNYWSITKSKNLFFQEKVFTVDFHDHGDHIHIIDVESKNSALHIRCVRGNS